MADIDKSLPNEVRTKVEIPSEEIDVTEEIKEQPPVEVIPESRSYVSRKIIALGGEPKFRAGFLTDQGNQIVDIHNIEIRSPLKLEMELNNIPGVVDNGIFAKEKPSKVLVSD